MNPATTRRQFLRLSTATLALAGAAPRLLAAESQSAIRKRPNLKAIMWGTIGVKGSVLEKMQAVKAAGFDSVEMNSHMNHEEVLKAREETGLKIVSVCNDQHW